MKIFKKGVNFFGPYTATDSNGRASKLGMTALSAAGVDYKKYLLNRSERVEGGIQDKFERNIIRDLENKVNLFYINARRVSEYFIESDINHLKDFYNIAYWVHDVKIIRDSWASQARFFQEIWVPSNHVQNSIAPLVGVPVITVPYAIEINEVSSRILKKISLDVSSKDEFKFLTVFNVIGDVERKNILYTIRVFLESFGNRLDVVLLIKVKNLSLAPNFEKILREVSERNRNIRFLDGAYDDHQMSLLYDSIDAYISLHRAEGFGLTIAEAMSRGIPVIVTGYSGNMDYCIPGETRLVRYREVEVGCERTLIRRSDTWAEPDMSDASNALLDMVENHLYWVGNALNARDRLQKNYSPTVVGERIKSRITSIYNGFKFDIRTSESKVDVVYDISNRYGF